jgi:hypothetical protein
VSSSAATNELPSTLLDAVDGFFMIVNGEAVVEGVTTNVDKYIGVKQVRQLLISRLCRCLQTDVCAACI